MDKVSVKGVSFFALALFLATTLLNAREQKKRVDLVSYDRSLAEIKYKYLEDNYEFSSKYDLYDYVKNFKEDDPNLQKIIFIDYCEDPKIFNLPKNKLVCFKWEAIKILPKYYDPYSIVYTVDDDLVDGKKFFKFFYPVLNPMISSIRSFEEKKLCTMAVTNWTAERIAILDFFSQNRSREFEFYGRLPPDSRADSRYRGSLPGGCSSSQKLEAFSGYRFCFCFENTHTTRGYITEKIFDVFAAGAIPIYWGPENIEQYIPKACFVDYRDFSGLEELYNYISTMSKTTYDYYIKNITEFLQSDQAFLFSRENFDLTIYEAATR